MYPQQSWPISACCYKTTRSECLYTQCTNYTRAPEPCSPVLLMFIYLYLYAPLLSTCSINLNITSYLNSLSTSINLPNQLILSTSCNLSIDLPYQPPLSTSINLPYQPPLSTSPINPSHYLLSTSPINLSYPLLSTSPIHFYQLLSTSL